MISSMKERDEPLSLMMITHLNSQGFIHGMEDSPNFHATGMKSLTPKPLSTIDDSEITPFKHFGDTHGTMMSTLLKTLLLPQNQGLDSLQILHIVKR